MPIKAAKGPVHPERAKAEVQQEFASIRREVEAERESADTKAGETARLRAAQTRQGA